MANTVDYLSETHVLWVALSILYFSHVWFNTENKQINKPNFN
jgi:hypothetical protein